jgi:anti-sigma factor RsiW
MNCERFESLLADALGEELSAANRPAFEEHVRACERCRREYESASAALAAMRSLPAPPVATVGVAKNGNAQAGFGRSATKPYVLRWSALLRYAAAIVIAFGAGYLYRAEQPLLTATPGVGPAATVGSIDVHGVRGAPSNRELLAHASPRSFEAALAGAHLQNPSRSDLAKCMIAMFATPR